MGTNGNAWNLLKCSTQGLKKYTFTTPRLRGYGRSNWHNWNPESPETVEGAIVIVDGQSCHDRCAVEMEWVGKKYPILCPSVNHLLMVPLLANRMQKAASKRPQKMQSTGATS